MAATWPMAGAPRTIISRIAYAHLAGVPAGVLDEDVGQLALVDQVEDAAVLAERGPEPGRPASAPASPVTPSAAVAAGSGSRIAPAASADASLERLRRPDDRRRVWISSPANWRKKRRRPRSTVGRGRPGADGLGRHPGSSGGVGRSRVVVEGSGNVAISNGARSVLAQYWMTLVTRVRRAGRDP